jgi:uncharacterized protein YndB with AHSA1/START domain
VARSEASVEIARPAATVFPWLVDVDRRLRWVDGLEASEPLEPGEPRAGSRFRETLSQHGLRTTVETTVERLDAPREIALAVRGRGVAARTITTLTEQDGRTLLRSALETDRRGVAGRLVGGVVARQAGASLERSLQRLKELVEAA